MTLKHVTIALACLVFAACSPTSAGSPTSAAEASPAVSIKGFVFSPELTTVSVGTTVVWTNQDEILHTVTGGSTRNTGLGIYEASPDGRFNGRLDGAGTSFRFTFQDPGTYAYYCDRHRHMVATVVVK